MPFYSPTHFHIRAILVGLVAILLALGVWFGNRYTQNQGAVIDSLDTVQSRGVDDTLTSVDPRDKAALRRQPLSVTPRQLQVNLAKEISARYQVTEATALTVVKHAVEMGKRYNVDPLLILAVIAIESSFNPEAQSYAGAQGLMQVMTRIHAKRFHELGGEEKAFVPRDNIDVGTQILSGLINRTGSVKRGLKWYSGAANLPDDNGYSQRVFREYAKFFKTLPKSMQNQANIADNSTPESEIVAALNQVNHLPYSEWSELFTHGHSPTKSVKGAHKQTRSADAR